MNLNLVKKFKRGSNSNIMVFWIDDNDYDIIEYSSNGECDHVWREIVAQVGDRDEY